MSRWEPDARERLERAALELFVRQGFAQTTVPQITARAGLTTRTFFRHFADKREVLFGYQVDLPGIVAALMAAAPRSHGPMKLIAEGLDTIADHQFEGRLDQLRTRQAVILSDAGLRERELRKQSILSDAITSGFRDRGLDELTSTVAAHIAVTVFAVAVTSWLTQAGSQHLDYQPLSGFLSEALAAVRSVTEQ